MTECYPRDSRALISLVITCLKTFSPAVPEVVQTSVTFTHMLSTTVLFETTLPRTIRQHDRKSLLGSNYILTILKVRVTVETDPD